MRKRIMAAALLAFLSMSTSGCFLLFGAAAGGAGTAFWLSGKMTDQVAASYDATIAATEKTLAAKDMPVSKKTQSEKVTQFKSVAADGREVWIDIAPVTQTSTKIAVRVGAAGDKATSADIIEKIKASI
ncbi:MAG: DUF3568 family protein [Deltaproteobacteria bacterium]